MSPRLRAVVILALPLAVLALPFLPPGRHFPGQDFRDYFGPHARLAREHLLETGELPRWNPRQYAGVPYEGSAQNNFWYPPNLLLLALPEWTAWDLLVFLHLALAAAGAYRLARSYRLAREAAVIAGIGFGLSFSLLLRAEAGHLPNLVAASLAPWVLYRTRRALGRPDLHRCLALAGWIWALCVGGSPQFVLQAGVFAAFLALAEGPRTRPVLLTLGGAVALALGGAAPHLLPVFDVAAASTRADPAVQAVIRSHHSFNLGDCAGFLVPGFRWTPASQNWLWHEKVLYVGVLPLLLCVLAWKAGPRRPVLIWSMLLGLLLAEASTGFLRWLIPPFDRFRIPERIAWAASLAVLILAALGWKSAREGGSFRRFFAVPSVAGTLILLLIFRAPQSAACFLGAALLSWFILVRNPRWAALLLMGDLLLAAAMNIGIYGPEELRPEPWYARHIGPERSLHRLLDLTTWKSTPVGHGFHLLRGYGHPVPGGLSKLYASAWRDSSAEVETLFSVHGLIDPSILKDLNVRWIVAPLTDAFPAPWLRRQSHEGAQLWEDPGPRGSLWVSRGIGSVTAVRASAHEFRIEASCRGEADLVVSEAAWPGWRAEINGVPVPLSAFRDTLIHLRLPDGLSRVTLVFEAPGSRAGRFLGILSLLTALGLTAFQRFRSRLAPPMKA